MMNFVQSAFDRIISQNLLQSFFYFTRHIAPGGVAAQLGGVGVLGFMVYIDIYTPN